MPLSLDLSLLLIAVYCSPTMPPPIILGLRRSSLADCSMPTELFGYEQINTRSGLLAWIARMIGEKSVVLGGEDLSYTILKPYFLMLFRPPSAPLRENSASSAPIPPVCRFGARP